MWNKFKARFGGHFVQPAAPDYPHEFFLADRRYYLQPLMAVDLDQVLKIERDLYEGTLPWNRLVFLNEISQQHQRLYWGLFSNEDRLIGFIGCWFKGSEAHITNLAIGRAWQHQGLGRYLMTAMIMVAQHRRCTTVTLEARVDNVPALTLYHRLGFVDQRIQANYYDYDHSDAVSMCLTINK